MEDNIPSTWKYKGSSWTRVSGRKGKGPEGPMAVRVGKWEEMRSGDLEA